MSTKRSKVLLMKPSTGKGFFLIKNRAAWAEHDVALNKRILLE